MSENIKCIYQNTRGLRTKIARGLRNKILLIDFQMFALTETWLNDKIDSENIFDGSQFNVYRSDRTLRTYSSARGRILNENDRIVGGGCLLAIKNNIPAMRLNDWELEIPFDNVWLKISTTGISKLFVNCIYINDKASFEQRNQYLDFLQDVINRREPNAKFFILGDFNLPSIEWYLENGRCSALNFTGRMANEFINTLTCTNLHQLNHIKNTYNRTLDVVLSNIQNIKIKRTHGIVDEDPHHPTIDITFNAKEIKLMKPKKQVKLNFFKADYKAINEEISKIDWKTLFLNQGIDTNVDNYYSKMNEIIIKYSPKVKIDGSKYPNWYSSDLIRLIKEKEYYFKKKKGSDDPIFKVLFKLKRSEIKKLKKKDLHVYELNIESLITQNPKSFFCLH